MYSEGNMPYSSLKNLENCLGERPTQPDFNKFVFPYNGCHRFTVSVDDDSLFSC